MEEAEENKKEGEDQGEMEEGERHGGRMIMMWSKLEEEGRGGNEMKQSDGRKEMMGKE